MTSMFRTFARRFIRDDRGSMTVEFVLQFTIFFAIFATAVEIGYINIRHAVLERAVDDTVRDIRIGTGNAEAYVDVRKSLCDALAIDQDCEDNIQLEMVRTDPRGFAAPTERSDCRNMAEEINPVTEFTYGTENELMLMRVCLRYKPMFPTTGLATVFEIDPDGYAQLVSKSIFVQEPR